MKRLLVAALIVVGAAHMALASTTSALQITSGATTVTITDQTGTDLDGTAGSVLYINHNLDGWDITFAGGTSLSPGVFPFAIDIGSFTADCAAGGGCETHQLTISYSDIGFTAAVPAGGFSTTFSATIAGGSTSQSAWDDTTNTLFGTGTLIGSVGPFIPPHGSGTVSGGGPAGPAPYSLTITDYIAAGSHGVSLDGNITTVPEPSSLVLFGTGLLAFASFAKRKFRRS